MKIVYLQDDFEPYGRGGAAAVVSNTAKATAKGGNEVCVITTVQKESDSGTFHENGIRIERIYATPYEERWRAYRSLYNPETVTAVEKILEEIKPDVIHAHNIHYYLSYYCLKIAKQSGAKVFLTAHDVMLFHYGKLVEFIDPKNLSCPVKFNYRVTAWQQLKKFRFRYNPFRNIIIKHYLKYVDKVFAVSNALKEALNQNEINNVEVVYNGIDIDNWQINASALNKFRDKYNLHDKKIVLFGGRLSSAKGGYQAISAMVEVIKKIPTAILLIMGDKNEYTEKMIKIAEEKGIKGNLVFAGWISGDDLKSAYQVGDLLIMPSVCFDTFGMVCLEAMACKKPVIATCFGGAKEIVVDGMTGCTVNPFDINLLSGKMIDLLVNPAKAEKFGNDGYERARSDFDLSVLIDKTIKFY